MCRPAWCGLGPTSHAREEAVVLQVQLGEDEQGGGEDDRHYWGHEGQQEGLVDGYLIGRGVNNEDVAVNSNHDDGEGREEDTSCLSCADQFT